MKHCGKFHSRQWKYTKMNYYNLQNSKIILPIHSNFKINNNMYRMFYIANIDYEWRWNMTMKYDNEIWQWNTTIKYDDKIRRWNMTMKYENEIWRWNMTMKYEDEIWGWNEVLLYINTLKNIYTSQYILGTSLTAQVKGPNRLFLFVSYYFTIFFIQRLSCVGLGNSDW